MAATGLMSPAPASIRRARFISLYFLVPSLRLGELPTLPMSIVSVTYEEFQASHQSYRNEGGPWIGIIDRGRGEGECSSQLDDWCDGYCLTCATFPTESLTAYHTKISSNISVRMDQYGGASNLDFTWTFWPLYTGTNITAGRTFPLRTQIGDAVFDDDLPAVDYGRFFGVGTTHSWEPSPRLTHSGSTALPRSSDGSLGYIPITISFTMVPATNHEFLNYYIKGIDFKINTPIQSVTPPTSTSTSSSSSPSSSSTSSVTTSNGTIVSGTPSLTLLDPISLTDSGQQPTSSADLQTQASPDAVRVASVSTPAIVGAAMGSIAFISLIIIAVMLWRKRRKRSSLPMISRPYDIVMNPVEKGHGLLSPSRRSILQPSSPTTTFSQPTESASINPFQSPGLGRTASLPRSAHSATQSDTGPSSGVSEVPHDPPPIYDTVGEDRIFRPLPSVPLTLAQFASANRGMINEDLEARLEAAGYLPTDDPDSLTEQEWKEHKVTKLELLRLRTLFNRNRASYSNYG